MKQTANYQLNQWDADDRILRTDFNRDNLIIENGFQALKAALEAERQARDRETAALRAENLTVKLADVTTGQETARVDVDVSHIRFTQYGKIELCLDAAGLAGNGRVYLRVNGYETYRANFASGSGGSIDKRDTPFLANWWVESGAAAGVVLFAPPAAGTYVRCISWNTDDGSYEGWQAFAPCKWPGLRTLNFLRADGSMLPAGTRVILYGTKR